ncbi:MAG: type 2 lanthipeptide synthetase LanM [Negativicutes bacterium]|nr:type 2 lanthipeptide synthetase LanM [Negativicutes bacterium]
MNDAQGATASAAIDFLTLNSSAENLTTDCPVWPFLAYYVEKTKRNLTQIEKLDHEEGKAIINGYVGNLSTRITNTAQNVLSVERDILNQTIKPHKLGVFEHYAILRKNNEYLLNILESYPELTRTLQKITDNFIDQTYLLALRLTEDKPGFKALTSLSSAHLLLECTPSEGETHNGSLTACTLTFTNGSKVVYKPRNLDIENRASILLEYLSKKADSHYSEWKIPLYIVHPTHGWAKYFPQLPANDIADVQTYYRRAGFLLGYCTAFTTSDITCDNLICNTSHPIPIDLETIFYCVLNISSIPKEVRWNSAKTSILPNWTWKGTDGIGADLSALGGLKEQYVSLNLYQHLEDDKDNGRFGTDGVKIYPGKNVLYLNGCIVSPWEYEREIQEGFTCFFETLKKHQAYVIKKIRSFKGLTCRYVPRPTATYHYAIQCSLHASLMCSTEKRKAFLTKILDNDNAPAVGFLPAEVNALLNIDIPYAKSCVGELSFSEPHYSGKGHLPPGSYLDGLSNSISYIENFTEARRRFEISQISNTLTAMRYMYEHDRKLTTYTFRKEDNINDTCSSIQEKLKDIRFAQNSNIDFLIEKISYELSNNGLWYGFHASPGGYIEYSELGEDLYYGLSGMAYGLAMIHQNKPIPKESILNILNEAYNRVNKKLHNRGTHLGGSHFGLSSSVLPLIITLKYFEDNRHDELLSQYKSYFHSAISEDWWQKYFWGADLLSGMHGTLSVLTKLYELTKDNDFRELACNLYKKIDSELVLLNGKRLVQFDRSITTRNDSLLSGLSHGVMGCAYSIFYFYRTISKNQKIYNTFVDFLDWELQQYDKNIKNWPDYRRRSESTNGEFSWSHGLPGNYLILQYFSEHHVPEALEFIRNNPPCSFFSYENLRQRKRPINDSICHGAYGLLNIIKSVYPPSLLDQRVYTWLNTSLLAEHDTRELRTRAADPLGLWVGKTGAILGAHGVLNESFKFPFLTHQMDYLQ